MFSFTNFDNPLPINRIRMVRPNKTNTSEMLMVDVIFAFTNRAVDIFFFFDIKKGYTKKNPIALNKTVFSKLAAK
ncbi:hypothetical protein SDC9_203863 [bioreactor metagenome]|uniref:Uncharacterized protein n=1 Tax=bioreactor metagenome TaxID=1076179 RepID=A0A645IYE7_9ZZZZ